MFFLLDNDTAVAVGRVIRQAGHQCISAAPSGIAAASDDTVSVFADERKAVVLTHDREFSQRRRRNVFGKHIYLDCRQWEAADLVRQHLDELIILLNSREAIFIKLSHDGPRPYPTRWT